MSPPLDDRLMPASEAAHFLGIAISTFWRDVKAGLLPAPFYISVKAPRWRLSELRAVIDAAPRQARAA